MLLILHLLISGLSSVVCLFCLFVLPVLLSTWHAKEYISPLMTNLCHLFPRRWEKWISCSTQYPSQAIPWNWGTEDSIGLFPAWVPEKWQTFSSLCGRPASHREVSWENTTDALVAVWGRYMKLQVTQLVPSLFCYLVILRGQWPFKSHNELICKAGIIICLAFPGRFLQTLEWGIQTVDFKCLAWVVCFPSTFSSLRDAWRNSPLQGWHLEMGSRECIWRQGLLLFFPFL